MKKILIVCDIPGWAFDKNAQSIKKYCPEYEVNIMYADRPDMNNHINVYSYDVILNLCDSIGRLIHIFDPKKQIFCVRSNLYLSTYRQPYLSNKVAILAVANQSMVEVFKPYHDRIYVAPGGVDTDVFIPKKDNPYDFHCPHVVGWAGTNYDPNLRGLHIIKEACDKAGFVWKPAYREDKWRTTEEMVSYYQNDIDIYIDASLSAGRQNGLLEAAACGKPIIATKVGIVDQLITFNRDRCGLIVDRSSDSIYKALPVICRDREMFSINARKEIEENWSWKVQIKIFKKMFEEIICQ